MMNSFPVIYSGVVVAVALALFIRTVFVAFRTPILKRHDVDATTAVDLLVPARNEVDRGLERHIRLMIDQTCERARVIVTDDRSTDATATVLRRLEATSRHRLVVLIGRDKPPDWMGKTYALEQAKLVSSAPWLALVDADVACHPTLVASALAYAEEEKLDALCVLPDFEYRTFWVGVALPAMIWLSAMRVSPTQTNRPSSRFAFGFGNFILVRRSAHDRIGGFQSYRASVLDDCEVIERLKADGARVRVVHGPSLLCSPMYDTLAELWAGFSKNSFAALRYSWLRVFGVLAAIAAALLQPFVAQASVLPQLALVAASLAFGTALVSGLRVRAPLQYYVLFPLGLAIGAAIIFRSALASATTRGIAWKGRLVR